MLGFVNGLITQIRIYRRIFYGLDCVVASGQLGKHNLDACICTFESKSLLYDKELQVIVRYSHATEQTTTNFRRSFMFVCFIHTIFTLIRV